MLKFALTLSAKGRNQAGRQEIVSYLEKRGIKQTGGGLATMSFAASDEAFATVFRTSFQQAVRSADTIGASAPVQKNEIPVPGDLMGLVDDVSVTPEMQSIRKSF
ncbi:MAG: hypothetical protein AAF496_15515 [Pseudomonadota bacterium]